MRVGGRRGWRSRVEDREESEDEIDWRKQQEKLQLDLVTQLIRHKERVFILDTRHRLQETIRLMRLRGEHPPTMCHSPRQ